MKQAGFSSIDANLQCRLYFISWKISEPRHWEKGHAKPDLPGVPAHACCDCSGSLWDQWVPGVLQWDCAQQGSHAENKTCSGDSTQHPSSSCFKQHMGWNAVADKSLQKVTVPQFNGGNAEPCVKLAFMKKLWDMDIKNFALFQWSCMVDKLLENKNMENPGTSGCHFCWCCQWLLILLGLQVSPVGQLQRNRILQADFAEILDVFMKICDSHKAVSVLKMEAVI